MTKNIVLIDGLNRSGKNALVEITYNKNLYGLK